MSELDSSYTCLRQFTPNVLAAIDFHGGPGTSALMAAVDVLKELNAADARKVPADAPAGLFGQVRRLSGQGAQVRGDTAYRCYWELCVILWLRDGLRAEDVWVPGSRRCADPATYLYTLALREGGCTPLLPRLPHSPIGGRHGFRTCP